MPTENRSSNTEMVSVPREPTREMLAAAREVNGIFPTWRAMVAAAPEQQSQVPVGALLIDEYFDSREVGDVDVQLDSEMCGQLAAKYPGQSLPIYVHPAPADAGEVERLRFDLAEMTKSYEALGELYAGTQKGFERLQAERKALLHEWRNGKGMTLEQSISLIERIEAALSASAEPSAPASFQQRVQPWMMECFGERIAGDREERNHRFLEEALELVQALGATVSEAHQLVHYVFGRAVGEPPQEVGGVMVTLAALCLANDLDMHELAEAELSRVWTKVEEIRAKQASKPQFGPIPGVYPEREPSTPTAKS